MRVHQHGAAVAADRGQRCHCRRAGAGCWHRHRGAGSNYTNCRADPRCRRLIVEPPEHAIGRSWGGLTTKLHMLTDGRGRPLVLVLTAGNVSDTTVFAQLISELRVPRSTTGRPRTRPDYVLADKGYSSRANRALLRRRGIAHTIPEPADQQGHRARRGSAGRPVGFDKVRYRRRSVVERGFCQLKHWRGLASGPYWAALCNSSASCAISRSEIVSSLDSRSLFMSPSRCHRRLLPVGARPATSAMTSAIGSGTA